jgi:hypothetical protein
MVLWSGSRVTFRNDWPPALPSEQAIILLDSVRVLLRYLGDHDPYADSRGGPQCRRRFDRILYPGRIRLRRRRETHRSKP